MQYKFDCKKIIIILLVVLTLFTAVNVLVPAKEFSENENRTLSKMPHLTLTSLADGSFMTGFENFVTDKFIFRDFFVTFKSYCEKFTLKDEKGGVYFGKDGYFIEKPSSFNKGQLDKKIDSIKTLFSLRRYNITVSVIPTAFEIEKDKLPANAYNKTVQNEINYIKASLHNTKINFVDTTDILKQNSEQYLYYRTDHHQTANGSYYVYYKLGNALSYTPYSKEDYNIETVSDDFLGTTWSKVMLRTDKKDSVLKYSLKNGEDSVTVTFPGESATPYHSLYKNDSINTKDKYSYYLGGNHGLTVIHSSNENGRKLVIFKDSYANSIIPFLSRHFEYIHVIDLRYYNDDIIKYLSENQLNDILLLYNTSTFMTDDTIELLGKYTLTSEYSKTAFGKIPKSVPVETDYFEDAAFIGDSLTEGLRSFSGLDGTASFYAEVGNSLSGILSNNFVNIKDGKKGTVIDAVKETKPNKIYIMLGINDLPTKEKETEFKENYSKVIKELKKVRPDSTIYVQAIMPVSRLKDRYSEFKNQNIYEYNKILEELTKEEKVYFLTPYEMFVDDEGYLRSDLTPDGVHLEISLYKDWVEYLKCHTVPELGTGTKKADSKDKNTFNGNSKIDIASLADKLNENISFEDSLSKTSPNSIFANYGIEPNLLADGILYTGSGITAEEIAVFEVTDPKNIKKIKLLCERHIEEKRKAYKDYIPKELEKLKSPVIIAKDNVVAVCISDDNKKAKQIIADFLN